MHGFKRKTKPSNTDPAVIAAGTAAGHHDPDFVHRFFNGASTEALELAQKVIGGILEERSKGA